MKATSILLLGILLATTAAFAQMDIPKPGPELKKLDYFVGHWTAEGDVKPGPMGPGGKFTKEEHSEWMDGGYFVVIHSKYSGAGMPSGTSTAYMGYDTQEKVYTYDAFRQHGRSHPLQRHRRRRQLDLDERHEDGSANDEGPLLDEDDASQRL